jgi:hypothetical protein
MPLPPRAIEELKAIYRKEYGRDLSDEAAWEMGHRLLRIFAVLTRARAGESRAIDEVRTISCLTEPRPDP